MVNYIAESELILNARGAIYHLDVRPEELAETVITVGDPDRVAQVSKHFDEMFFKSAHREFITHTGRIGQKPITVVSTGIGTDNIDIVMNELDALMNIDFETRMIRPKKKSMQVIRIGTCGSLQGDIPVDGAIAGSHGLGIDNLLNYYMLDSNEEEGTLLQQFVTQTQLNSQFSRPYIATASMALLKHFVDGFYQGITVTCPGFYGPQGRVLRLGLRHPEFVDKLTQFNYGSHRIVNFEMETSAIYGLGKLLGHQCLSLNAVVANRVTKTFSKDGNAAVENLIVKALETIEKI
ncbi:MAG TPA: nucleoside phosphorylase [Phnomibacter sp.]|nr:nucleoside phosphorylase [Phnomibacter sp.]